MADARWVVTNAEATLHAAHTRIVDGLAGGLPFFVLEQVADTGDRGAGGRSPRAPRSSSRSRPIPTTPTTTATGAVVSDSDRAELERGRKRAWTCHLTAAAAIDQLDTATRELTHR